MLEVLGHDGPSVRTDHSHRPSDTPARPAHHLSGVCPPAPSPPSGRQRAPPCSLVPSRGRSDSQPVRPTRWHRGRRQLVSQHGHDRANDRPPLWLRDSRGPCDRLFRAGPASCLRNTDERSPVAPPQWRGCLSGPRVLVEGAPGLANTSGRQWQQGQIDRSQVSPTCIRSCLQRNLPSGRPSTAHSEVHVPAFARLVEQTRRQRVTVRQAASSPPRNDDSPDRVRQRGA